MPEPPRKVDIPNPGASESGGRAAERRRQFDRERGLGEAPEAPPASVPDESPAPEKDAGASDA